MDYKGIAKVIANEINKNVYDIQPYKDYHELAVTTMDINKPFSVNALRWLSETIMGNIKEIAQKDVENGARFLELHKSVLLSNAKDDFDSYLLYVEWNRSPEKQFYAPRRSVLKIVVDALQDLHDDKLDLLSISLPPGVGKSTLAIFYLTWLAGKYPSESCLTGSHSNSWVRGAYDECLRIMDRNGEYLWHDVFKDLEVSSTNAKDCRIDIGTRKRFETLEFTSIGTGNAGLYRAMRLLYCDDLVSGSEVALSKDRLDKLWGIYTTDLRQRKLGAKCKELHIATRWSVWDVLGRLELEYGESDRARFITIPAMDENDESNFDYPYGVGYSTKALREQRDVMDDTDWKALFMNQPIEREGLLYSADELRRYFELPDCEPDAIIAVCDTKDKGTDYFCMPVAYQYGPDFYIDGVICDNGNPDIVEPRLVDILVNRQVQLARFESNQAGGRIASSVQEKVKERGGRTKITTKYTTAQKETKIIVNSPWIKDHCLFKDESIYKSDKEYRRFMQFLCNYTMAGKNKHDDAPDAMAQLSEYIQSFALNKVEIVKRPF